MGLYVTPTMRWRVAQVNLGVCKKGFKVKGICKNVVCYLKWYLQKRQTSVKLIFFTANNETLLTLFA